ncbi:MAG: SprB repeat-containing protein, partial [Flavobacteriales bacterium]|nr:SprB repeat-containing protein [Flavobacteriales bacterium]
MSGAGTVTINDNVNVYNVFTMSSGNVSTSTNIITLGTSTSNEGTLTHSAGTIIGRFERWINNPTSYTFPVGSASNFNPVILNITTLTLGGSVISEFVASDPGNNGLPIGEALNDTVPNQYTEGYWDLAAANGFGTTDFALDLDATGFSSYTISASTRIIKRPGAASPWTDPLLGTHVAAVAPVVKRSALSGLGQFGIGNLCATPVTTISGSNSVCTSSIEAYSVVDLTSTYAWAASGGTVSSPTGDNITVTWNGPPGNASAFVRVIETKDCGQTGKEDTMFVTVNTLPTSVITGDANPHTGTTKTYTVLETTGYSYTFSLLGSLGTVNTPCCDTTTTITWGSTTGSETIRVTVTGGGCAADVRDLVVSVDGVVLSFQTGSWSALSTWGSGSGPIPIATDSVNIGDGHDVTVDVNSTCAEINLIQSTGGSNTVLGVATGITMTVSENLVINGDGNSFSRVELDGTGSTLTIGTDITFNGAADATLDMGAAASVLNIAGAIIQNSAGVLTNTGSLSTVNFNGSAAQTMNLGTGMVYDNVTFANSGSGVTLGAAITSAKVSGNMVIASGTLNTGGFDIEFDGDWDNSGTVVFSAGDSVIMAGPGPDAVKGATSTTFENFKVYKTSGGVTIETNTSITGSLSLNGGGVTSPLGTIITLVSNASGTAFIPEVTGSGTIDSVIIQRHLNNVEDDWRLLGAAVIGTDIEDWNGEIVMSGFTGTEDAGSSFTSFYTYDETNTGAIDAGYTEPASTATTLGMGVGYYVWVGNALNTLFTKTMELRGTPEIGTKVISCSHTPGVPTPDDEIDGWNLIANPYPSDVVWDNVTLAGGVTPYAYVLNPVSGGSYITIKHGAPVNDSSIASMQGFWVKTSGSAGTVTFDENDKSTNDNGPFYKMQVNHPDPGLTLKYTSGGRSEDLEIRFDQGATENYDPFYDGLKLNGPSWQLYNFSAVSGDSINLSWNFLPELNQSYSVPLSVVWSYPAFMSGTMVTGTVEVSDFSVLPSSSCLILEDLDSGIFTDLRVASYTFAVPDSLTRPRLMLHIGAPISKTTVSVACNGGTDGMAIAGGQGTGPWSYVWVDNIGDTIKNTANVNAADTLTAIAGDYTVYVTSTGGMCLSMADTFQITQPSTLGANLVSSQDVTCFGNNDGAIDISVNGGTLPYAFSWSSGQFTEDIGGLDTGTYVATITDGNNCVTTQSVSITEPAELLSTGNTTDVTCFGDANGAVDVTTAGGTAPYAFSWSTGDTLEDLTNVGPASYTLNVTDASGCVTTEVFNVTEPTVLVSSVTATQDLSCFGAADGSIDVSVTGGSVPYAYLWTSGQTSGNISGIAAGAYTLNVTDANGCTSTVSSTINEPTQIVANGTTVDVTCFGDADGLVDLSTSGGTSPYGFSWSSGPTVEDISNLGPGNYTVAITDALGCTQTVLFTVTEPAVLASSLGASLDVSCFGLADGSVDVDINGGTTPYGYSWASGETTEDLSAVGAGSYVLIITDANSCT